MATFTPEEVESMRQRGNYYCRRTWMALYDGIIPTDGINDEQKVRDFMVDKYEKKRYYVEPDATILKKEHNNNNSNSNNNNQRPKLIQQQQDIKQQHQQHHHQQHQQEINNTSSNNKSSALRLNGVCRPETKNLGVNKTSTIITTPLSLTNGRNNDFVADFAHADIFNAANNNSNTTNNTSFVANFDNNPVFNNSSK